MNSNPVNSRSGLQRLSEHSQIKQAANQSTQVSGMQPHTPNRINKSKEPLGTSNKIESWQMSTSMSELLIEVASFANAFWNQTSTQSTPTSMYICSSTACADRIGMHAGFRTLSDSQTTHSTPMPTPRNSKDGYYIWELCGLCMLINSFPTSLQRRCCIWAESCLDLFNQRGY